MSTDILSLYRGSQLPVPTEYDNGGLYCIYGDGIYTVVNGELKKLAIASAGNVTALEGYDTLISTINGKANASDLTAHTTNGDIHFTAAERTKLAGIAENANNYTYTLPAAGTALGGVKSGGDVTISNGVITVSDDSHNHVISNVDGLQGALNDKAAAADLTSHTTNGDIHFTAAERTKLAGIAEGANKYTYTLPVATSGALGGVKSGGDVTISSDGIISIGNDSHTHDNRYYTETEIDAKFDAIIGEGAAESLDTIGEISAALKGNADIIDTLNQAIGNKANASDLTSHTGNTTVHITAAERNTWNAKASTAAASQSAAGLMSADDKKKLDGITAGANKYTLPVATSSALGGVLSGGDVTISATGVITVNDDSHAHIISNVDGLQSALDAKAAASTVSSHTGNADIHFTAAERTKLAGIAEGANNYTYTLPTAGSTLGGVKTTSSVSSNSGYTACPIISGVVYYKDTDTTYTGSNGISISASNVITNSGVRSVATGSTNGTISVNTNGTAAEVAVKGLGSAAYTNSNAYDAAGTGQTKANAALASAKTYTDTALTWIDL